MKSIGLLFSVVLFATACTSGQEQAKVPSAEEGAGEVREDLMPATMLGLNSAPEDVSEPFEEAKDRAYVSSVRMWSLRESDRLRATVQVARFMSDASPERRDFQRSVVAQIGQTAPRERLIGDQVVYVTSANEQAIYMWFENIHLILVSVSQDYLAPRALLRTAIQEINP